MTKAFRLRDSKTIAMLCLALGLATMRTAAAQSAGAQAEVMFREARVLLEAGKVAETCAAFESSQKLEPATSTLITARAPAAPPWTVEVTIAAEADTKIVEIPRLGKPSAPVVAGKKAAGAVRASSGPPADRGGTITVPRVPPASTKRHVALGMAVSGLACGGVAAWLYFTGRAAENRSTSVNSARVDAVPVVGAAMGLAIMGGF